MEQSVSRALERDLNEMGVITLTQLLNAEEVAALHRWLQTVVDRRRNIPASFEPEFEPGSDEVRKLRRLYWNDQAFWENILAQTALPAIIQHFVGAPVSLTFHAAFLKPAKVGTQVVLHQDQALWKYDYPDAVSIWIAITPAKRHNGCLIGCPKSHTRGEVLHRKITGYPWHPGIDWRIEGLAEPVYYELEPGDALMWHRYFVHGSEPNLYSEPRWGIVMVFVNRTQRNLRTIDRADF
jgi:ectoine hydroxylase-related dioxygenase (phytanoyl-CoA dioxygenase family)